MLPRSKFTSKQLRAMSYLSKGKDRQQISTYLYTPRRKLATEIRKLDKLVGGTATKAQRASAGKAMERIVYLLFSGLEGYSERLSYQSAGPQIDLLIRGNRGPWFDLFDYLHLERKTRGILVEAKAIGKVVDDKTFARFCSVIHHNMKTHVGLGVFVTLHGASGFEDDATTRKMSDARLRQALFHAHTGVPIIVLDRADLGEMTKPGALVDLLEKRIVEIEEHTGVRATVGKYLQCSLPAHLKGLDK